MASLFPFPKGNPSNKIAPTYSSVPLVEYQNESVGHGIDTDTSYSRASFRDSESDRDILRSKDEGQLSSVDANGRMWNPIWLSAGVLIGFAVWFLALFITLIALNIYSEKHGGLVDEVESRHYLWTYLPTAIFVITVSLWRQVDFYVKELTPWDEMKRGATPGRRSILLDYIDPFVIVSLYRAIKNRHWAVVTSTIAFLLLKLATVFSAATLVLTQTPITQSNMPLTVKSVFDASGFGVNSITQDAVNQFYGNAVHNLPFQYGVQDNLAVQTFTPAGLRPAGANLSAEVSGFSTSLSCEQVKMDGFDKIYRPWISIQAPFFVTNFSTSDCKIDGVVIGQGADHGFFFITGQTQNYQGMFVNYTCNDGVTNWNTSHPDYKAPVPAANPDVRFLLSMADIRWEIEGPNNVSEPAIKSWNVNAFTGFLCKPNYSIDKYKVDLSPDANALVKAEKIPGTSSMLEGFTSADLAASILGSLEFASFGNGNEDYIILPVQNMFMLLAGMNNNSRQGDFIDEKKLSDFGTRATQGIGTQIGAQSLLKEKSSDVSGSIIFFRQRLQVKRLTVGLLATTLGLLIVLTVILMIIPPLHVVPSPPESVSFAAAVLTSSDKFRNYLRGLSMANSYSELSNAKFFTFVDTAGRFRLEPEATNTPLNTGSLTHPKERWWRPIATGTWFVICMLILPLALIAVLEIIQYESDKNQGLAYVDETSATYRYGVAYVPVLVMLGVSSMYNNYDFAISVLAPFSKIRKSTATASASITTSIVGKLPPHAFLMSLRNGHFAHCLTILAAFASSFLTIIASGLYSPHSMPSTHAISIKQADSFNLTHIDTSQNDNFAGSTAALIAQHNLTYPQWTYDNLVFPSISSPSSPLGIKANFTGSFITVKIPALRASLNCSALAQDSVSINAFYWAGETSAFQGSSSSTVDDPGSVKLSMEANFSSSLAGVAPDVAAKMGPAAWSTTLFVNNNTKDVVQKTYIGVGTPVQWFPFPGDNETDAYQAVAGTSLSETSLANLDIQPYYPGFALLFGTASAKNTGRVGEQNFAADRKNVTFWDADLDVAAALCSQVLETVQTEVTLDWPGMTISQTKPPVPDESTSRVITNDDTKGSAWFFDRPGNKSNPRTDRDWFEISMNTFLFAVTGKSSTAQTLDGWMTTLAYGKDGIPLNEMAGYANREKLFNASSRLYGRYAAQAINFNMRNTSPPSGTTLSSYQATFSADGQRLVQNRLSKIILQIILGFMVLCGAIAFVLSNTKNILKYPPTSIAGKMVLVAHSELCNSRKVIPEGAEWHENSRAFDGWFFSLGWWTGDLSRMSVGALPDLMRERWYGIDIGKADKDPASLNS